MENKTPTFVVPWDFTVVSKYALDYAISISKQINGKIEVVHIISKHIRSEEKKALEEKVRSELAQHTDIPCGINILKGSIYKTIADFGEDTAAVMVIMGTHGIKGTQKIFGSKAYRVLFGSKIPFLIVNEKPEYHYKFNNILLPIDFKEDNAEKLESAIFFGKLFNSRIHLLKAPVSSITKEKIINANLNLAIQLLSQRKIEHEIHSLTFKTKGSKEMLKFAQTINADLILIMATKLNITDVLLGEHEQNIISNSANIPVMYVNPS